MVRVSAPCIAILTVLSIGAVLASTDDDFDASAGLDELMTWAEEHNPGLQAARHRYEAARARGEHVAGLPDPALTVKVAAVPIETRAGPQQGQISVSQRLPGRGKREARAEVELAAAQVALAELERRRSTLRLELARAWYDLYLLERSVEIEGDNRDLLVYLEEVVRKAYETGRASYADLIGIQVEIGRLENELRALRDRRAPARERVNTRLHREPGAALPTPRLDDAPLVLFPQSRLREAMRQSAPELAEIDARIERAGRSVTRAEMEARPDWSVSLTWLPTASAIRPGTPDSGDDPVLAGVTVHLPVWREKYRAAEREAGAIRSAATVERSGAEDTLRRRLEDGLYRFRNADREIRLYRDTLLPKADQSFEASESGFRTGTVRAPELVDSQRVLLQFRLSYEVALVARILAVEELRHVVGSAVVEEQP